MSENEIFDLTNINIIARDFGAYIGLLLSSKTKIINKLILLSPVLNIERHVYGDGFPKVLDYVNRFLPGHIRGIENVINFIEMTKKELSKKEFNIHKATRKLKNKKLIIITGEEDKITPILEVKKMTNEFNLSPELVIMKSMNHDCIICDEKEEIDIEIQKYFL